MNAFEQNNKNEIQIEPIGSFFGVDSEGYLINPTSLNKIQEHWQPAIQEIIGAYKSEFGKHLKSVYVRGSVAKGEAVDFVSDLDMFGIVDVPKESLNSNWKLLIHDLLLQKYPFMTGIDLGVIRVDHISEKYLTLTRSVCVYGDPVEVPGLTVGKHLISHASKLDQVNESLKEVIYGNSEEKRIKSKCVWYMKELLRSSNEILLERTQLYTRDLYKCYELFSKYYPEKEAEMKEVLYLALNPTANKEKLTHIADTFGAWLLEESKKHI